MTRKGWLAGSNGRAGPAGLAGMIAAGLAVALLPGFGWAQDKPQAILETSSTYDSRQSYLQSRERAFVALETAGLVFVGKDGQERRVKLGRDRKGFDRKPFIRPDGKVLPVVIRSTRAYESGYDVIEFLGPKGQALGEVRAPSLAYLLSPSGETLVVAHPARQYAYTSGFSVFKTPGIKTAELQGPFPPNNPRFVFSSEGNVGALIAYSDSPSIRGAIVIFSAAGQVLGTYEATGWMPQAGHIDSRMEAFPPIALVDEKGSRVISVGYDMNLKTRTVVSVTFKGQRLWQWQRPGSTECPAALQAREIQGSVVIIDFCSASLNLYSLDLENGQLLGETSLPLDIGNPTNAFTSTESASGQVLVSFRANGKSGPTNIVVLFDRNLNVAWKDLSNGPATETRFVGQDVVMFRGSKVHVGRFKK